MHLNDITGAIVDVAMEIDRTLGPGLLESVYREVMIYELTQRGFDVLKEVPIPVVWKSIKLDLGFRADLLVNNAVIVELKSIEALAPVHKKILLTYLRVADKRVGLLINFREELPKNGIHRVVNRFEE